MNEQFFCETVNDKAKELNINPLLLLSGIEGIYSFRDVPLNVLNYQLLDNLILSIFALRVGDQFHNLAQKNLSNPNTSVQHAAKYELQELSAGQIQQSSNVYLQSFAGLLNGKATIRRYHEKALEVAALEIRKVQINFNNDSIGLILLTICKQDLNNLLKGMFSDTPAQRV